MSDMDAMLPGVFVAVVGRRMLSYLPWNS
jgi:hypothetical protein